MGLFGTEDRIAKELGKINSRLDKFDGEDVESLPGLATEVVELKKTISNLEIQRDKKQEDYDRREREITHKIGLERKRMEFEREEAEKNARLSVREENLKSQEDRFQKEMEFMRERMEHEVDDLRDLLGKVMDMVPTVTVDRKVRENIKRIEGPSIDDEADDADVVE